MSWLPALVDWYANRRPSGDHWGADAGEVVSNVTCRASLPTSDANQTAGLPVRLEMNASDFPSGERLGWSSQSVEPPRLVNAPLRQLQRFTSNVRDSNA